jgi:3-methyladenine DNA glycosylase/8-oxoguanine DNA glycosylase
VTTEAAAAGAPLSRPGSSQSGECPEPIERVWEAKRPVDVARTLGGLRRGSGDPAHHLDDAGFFWRACAAPTGDVTLALRAVRGVVTARAWGDGAQWALDGLPALLGADDDWSKLDLALAHDPAAAPRLAEVLRQHPGVRLPATRLVLDSLVPAVLEQRVTGMEARRAWRQLLRRYGRPAPGPLGWLRVPPAAATLLDVPTWVWHRLGVDLQRQRAIRACATVANRLEECVTFSPDAALTRLKVVPGIGTWTAAETLQRAVGHPDAVSVGDFHLANHVVHFLTGAARGTDEQMLELLAPWAGQRQRVVRLIELAGVGAPRFAPRYAPLDTRAM